MTFEEWWTEYRQRISSAGELERGAAHVAWQVASREWLRPMDCGHAVCYQRFDRQGQSLCAICQIEKLREAAKLALDELHEMRLSQQAGNPPRNPELTEKAEKATREAIEN